MAPHNNNFAIRSILALCLLSASLAAQWNPTRFDAPYAFTSNNSDSMIEVLNFSGNSPAEVLSIRITASTTSSFTIVKIRPLAGGANLAYFTATPPSVGSMVPASCVGSVGVDDGRDDVILGVGSTIWFLAYSGAAITAPTATFSTSGEVLGVRTGDFNGDGFGDFAALTANDLSVYIYVSPGVFTPIVTPLALGLGSNLLAGEFNGDTQIDLAIAGQSVTFFTLATGIIQQLGTLAVGVLNPMPAAGDIDGVGDTDIVVFGDTQYTLLRRIGPNSFSVETPVIGGPATRLIDVDGDGDLDGACCGGGGALPTILTTPTTFHISINDGGVFRPAYKIPSMGGWHIAGVIDVNGDGLKDLVAGRTIYLARQSLGINPWTEGASMPAYQAAVTDFDGDGDPDWGISVNETHWNQGAGVAIVSGIHLLMPPPPGVSFQDPMIHGDFDGDGFVDLLVEETQFGVPVGMRLLLGRGGAFSLGPVALQGGVALSPYIGTSPDRVIVTDIDNDGDQDLIMRSAGPAFWSFLWLNNGSGVFSFSRSFDTEIVVAVGDLNQDGRKDLLVSDGRLRARVQLPNGSFAIAQALTSGSYRGKTPG
jgi:hypothetical protein